MDGWKDGKMSDEERNLTCLEFSSSVQHHALSFFLPRLV